MNDSDKGQVTATAAEVYEEYFLPALFAEWPSHVTDAADVRSGHRVLDVACGTGVLARHVAGLVGQDGSVTGVDINEGMLRVAKTKALHIEWVPAAAEALPFDDDSFDRVVSQFSLMFFENQTKAIEEMVRVLLPGSTFSVAVWDTLENTPG